MVVDILTAHGRLGGLNLELAAEIPRLIESGALLGHRPVDYGYLLHHVGTSAALLLHRKREIGGARLEGIEALQKLARFFGQAAYRLLIAADSRFASLDRPLELLPAPRGGLLLLSDERKLLLHLADGDAAFRQRLRLRDILGLERPELGLALGDVVEQSIAPRNRLGKIVGEGLAPGSIVRIGLTHGLKLAFDGLETRADALGVLCRHRLLAFRLSGGAAALREIRVGGLELGRQLGYALRSVGEDVISGGDPVLKLGKRMFRGRNRRLAP